MDGTLVQVVENDREKAVAAIAEGQKQRKRDYEKRKKEWEQKQKEWEQANAKRKGNMPN